jgi:adenosylmethionine-8-amino-7-oxononanoate aminotransferase
MKQHAAGAEGLPLVPIARGKGVWLYDFDGRRYLDGISSWWVNLFGHCHPRINAALREQLEDAGTRHARRLHASAGGRAFRAPVGADRRHARPLLLRFRRRIGDRNRAQDVLPLLAQPAAAGEAGILCLAGSYHGETVGALAVTDVALFKDAYAPLIRPARTCHARRTPGGAGETPAMSPAARAAALESHLEQHHQRIAALIVEPLRPVRQRHGDVRSGIPAPARSSATSTKCI